MKAKEIRELNSDDLSAKITDTRKTIVELRFQLAMRKLESPAKLRNSKKELARLLTIQTELAIAKEEGVNQSAPVEAKAPKKKTAEKKTAEKKTASAKA